MWRFLFTLIGFGLPLLSGASSVNADDESIDLISALQQRRGSIRSIVATVRGRSGDPGPPNEYLWTRHYWMEGERLRCDHEVPCQRADAARVCISTSCFNCDSAGRHLFYSDASPFPDARYSLTVSDIAQIPGAGEQVADLRWCGIQPMMFLELRRRPPYSMEDLQRCAKYASVENVELAGVPCKLVVYRLEGDTVQRLWLPIDKPEFVQRSDVEWRLPQGLVRQAIECTDWLDPKTMHHLPKSITFTRHDGETVTIQETIEIDYSAINEPIDPQVFSIRGLSQLPAGTSVHWVSTAPSPIPDARFLVWDGQAIVSGPEPASPRGPGFGVDQRTTSRKWFLIGNTVVLTLIGAALVIRGLRRRRPSH